MIASSFTIPNTEKNQFENKKHLIRNKNNFTRRVCTGREAILNSTKWLNGKKQSRNPIRTQHKKNQAQLIHIHQTAVGVTTQCFSRFDWYLFEAMIPVGPHTHTHKEPPKITVVFGNLKTKPGLFSVSGWHVTPFA